MRGLARPDGELRQPTPNKPVCTLDYAARAYAGVHTALAEARTGFAIGANPVRRVSKGRMRMSFDNMHPGECAMRQESAWGSTALTGPNPPHPE